MSRSSLRLPVAVLALAAAAIAPTAAARTAASDEHVCVSVNGVILEQSGNATCSTEPGSKSRAEARGDGAWAEVGGGATKSIATAVDGGYAVVFEGDHNRATAIGPSGAWAFGGSHNTAMASNGAFFAGAGRLGAGHDPDSSFNRAIADGPNSRANAYNGDHNSAIARDGGSAEAGYGDHIRATATGDGSVAGACGSDHLHVKVRDGQVESSCP